SSCSRSSARRTITNVSRVRGLALAVRSSAKAVTERSAGDQGTTKDGGCVKKILAFAAAFPLVASMAFAQGARPATFNVNDTVDLELLTHTELSDRIKDGWTSVFLVTGGTEERGPQDVLGGHNILAKSHATMAAKKLGKTIVAPVLPFAVNATGLNP